MSLLAKIKTRLKEPSTSAGVGVVVTALSAFFPAYAPLILGVAAVLRLRQRERPDRLAPGQPGEPARFLLLRAAGRDRSHDQTGLDVDEGGEGRVDSAHFP